jgi:glycosyltransferase involved in cell wall biosynthesis
VKFSIVMTVYERETLFPHALYSVLQQKFEDWELIVLADGHHPSAERDVALVLEDKYQGLWGRRPISGRISYNEQDDVPRGTVGNPLRRIGLDLATGDYICFLGHDCIYDKDYLLAHLENIEAAAKPCVSVVSVLYWTTYPLMIKEVIEDTNVPRDVAPDIPMYVGKIPWSANGQIDPDTISSGEIDLTCMCFPVVEARQVGAFSPDLDMSYDADFKSFDRLRSIIPVMVNNHGVFAGHF